MPLLLHLPSMLRVAAVLTALLLLLGLGAPAEAARAKVRARTKVVSRKAPVRAAGARAARPLRAPAVASIISRSPALARHAARLSGPQQVAADALVAQLAAGNMNPGIGTKYLFGDVFEARARNGARVYFRSSAGQIEILAKSTKSNQGAVIKLLRELYTELAPAPAPARVAA